MKNIVILILLTFILCLSLYAENHSLISSAPTLMLDSTSAEGMGLAYNSVMQIGKVNFIMQNPGILGSIKSMNAGISYIPWIFDTSFFIGNFAYPLPIAALGVSVISYNTGDFDYYLMDGSLSSDKLSMSEFMLMLGAGREIVNKKMFSLSIGLSVKFFSSRIYKYRSSGLSIDAGINGAIKPGNIQGDIIYGFAIQNIGIGPKLRKERSSLPVKIRIGAGYRFAGFEHNAMLIPLLEFVYDTFFRMNTGLEYAHNDMLFLRIGYSISSMDDVFSGFSTGLGLKYMQIKFDYGLKLVNEGDQSIQHSFSLSYLF